MAPTGMIPKVQDPLLKQTIAKLEAAKMDPKVRQSYDQIVTAGMQAMWAEGSEFDKERDSVLAQINTAEDIPKVVAHAAVKIISIVQNESKQQDILPGVGPAAILFMCHILEFVEVAKKIPVTEDILAETTKLTYQGLFHAYGITPEVLDKVRQGKAGAPPPSPPPTAPTATQPPAVPAGA